MKAFIRVIFSGVRLRTYGGNRSTINDDFKTLSFMELSSYRRPVYDEHLNKDDVIVLELVHKRRSGSKKVIARKEIFNLK